MIKTIAYDIIHFIAVLYCSIYIVL